MKIKISLLLFLSCFHQGFSQNHSAISNTLSFEHVLTQRLSDPKLKKYKLESSVMTITPGAIDTVKHVHDGELFGFVLDGKISIGLENEKEKIFEKGQMFYEKRNVLHSLTRNNSSDQPAKVLLLFVIKEGRKPYIKAPSHKKIN